TPANPGPPAAAVAAHPATTTGPAASALASLDQVFAHEDPLAEAPPLAAPATNRAATSLDHAFASDDWLQPGTPLGDPLADHALHPLAPSQPNTHLTPDHPETGPLVLGKGDSLTGNGSIAGPVVNDGLVSPGN